MSRNEFLRKKPRKHLRHYLYDCLNILLPILTVCVGIILFTQTYARLTGYNPGYCGIPWLVTTGKIFFIPKGYPFFNPGFALVVITSHPFDPLINAVLFNCFMPLMICVGIAVAMFFVMSIIRSSWLNKNEQLYGTARWGTEKDLRKFGLAQERGVVLGEFAKADLDFEINPKNSSISLTLKKGAPLVCHEGGTNTLMIAPTRSGKGVSSVIPTCLNYPQSMIIFDPKGELFQATAGFRQQFSRILKFSPISKDTVCFNPLEEVELSEQAFADIGLILSNMFEEPKGGADGASAFFDNMAQDLLTGLIFHVLASNCYTREQKNLSGVLSILSQAASEVEEGEDGKEGGAGDKLLREMMEAKHYDKNGVEQEYIHRIISDAASRCLGQHSKVRSDTFTTVFAKMRLFQDPLIANVTGHSDFKLQDFYDSPEPVSLYLTVPFSDITRIAAVFKLLINFILNKFSRGEAAYGESKLKNRILFLLDEFPVLGAFPFLSKTMGILAGYGITFYIIVQALSQIIDLYGQHHTFLDNCKTVVLYAPGKIEDAEHFSKAIGKESVTNESLSVSGSRFSTLNNLNASSQEVARDLINPDELMKLSPTAALILNQGMPPYLAQKVVYYMDPRFKDKANLHPPATKAELEKEIRGLPSYRQAKETAAKKTRERKALFAGAIDEGEHFDVVQFLQSFDDITDFAAPFQGEIEEDAPPPRIIALDEMPF